MDFLIRVAVVLGLTVFLVFVVWGIPFLVRSSRAGRARRAGSTQTSASDDRLAQDKPGYE